jgi:hypothetical protein
LKKGTIIRLFIGLLAVELIVMAVLVWPDISSRIFSPTAGNVMLPITNTHMPHLVASLTESSTATTRIIDPTRTPYYFTYTNTPSINLLGQQRLRLHIFLFN